MRRVKVPLYPGLAAHMAAEGHTDNYVADYLGKNVDYVRRRKNGLVEFDISDIKALMHLYSCGFDELFGASSAVSDQNVLKQHVNF